MKYFKNNKTISGINDLSKMWIRSERRLDNMS